MRMLKSMIVGPHCSVSGLCVQRLETGKPLDVEVVIKSFDETAIERMMKDDDDDEDAELERIDKRIPKLHKDSSDDSDTVVGEPFFENASPITDKTFDYTMTVVDDRREGDILLHSRGQRLCQRAAKMQVSLTRQQCDQLQVAWDVYCQMTGRVPDDKVSIKVLRASAPLIFENNVELENAALLLESMDDADEDYVEMLRFFLLNGYDRLFQAAFLAKGLPYPIKNEDVAYLVLKGRVSTLKMLKQSEVIGEYTVEMLPNKVDTKSVGDAVGSMDAINAAVKVVSKDWTVEMKKKASSSNPYLAGAMGRINYIDEPIKRLSVPGIFALDDFADSDQD